MVLRYFEISWGENFKEEEELFRGTPQECHKYLMENWSVDCLEITDLSVQSDMIHSLAHIQWAYENSDYDFMPEEFKKTHYKGFDERPLRYEEIASSAWKDINVQAFIFNKCLL